MVRQQAKVSWLWSFPSGPFQPCAEAEIKANGPVFLRLRLNPTLSSSCENTLSQTALALSPREKVRSSGPALESCCGFPLGEDAALFSEDTALRKFTEMGGGEKLEQHHLKISSGHVTRAVDFGIGGI